MAENKYNKGGDFKIKYQMFSKTGSLVPVGSKPFVLKYFNPNDEKKVVEASFDGTSYKNIIAKDDYYIVCLGKPNFETGRLFCEETITETDANFVGGKYNDCKVYDVGEIVRFTEREKVYNKQTVYEDVVVVETGIFGSGIWQDLAKWKDTEAWRDSSSIR
jgi:hypothetical protein